MAGSATVKQAGEALVDRRLDRAAKILDVDRLERLASASEERDDPRAAHHLAHAMEEPRPGLAQHEAGADDQVVLGGEEALQRELARAVVGFCSRMRRL